MVPAWNSTGFLVCRGLACKPRKLGFPWLTQSPAPRPVAPAQSHPGRLLLFPGQLHHAVFPGGAVPGGQLEGARETLADFQPREKNGGSLEEQVSGELAFLHHALRPLLRVDTSPV